MSLSRKVRYLLEINNQNRNMYISNQNSKLDIKIIKPSLAEKQKFQTQQIHTNILKCTHLLFVKSIFLFTQILGTIVEKFNNQLYNCLGVWFYDLMCQFFAKLFYSAQTGLQYIVYQVCAPSLLAWHIYAFAKTGVRLFCLTRFFARAEIYKQVPPCNITSTYFNAI